MYLLLGVAIVLACLLTFFQKVTSEVDKDISSEFLKSSDVSIEERKQLVQSTLPLHLLLDDEEWDELNEHSDEDLLQEMSEEEMSLIHSTVREQELFIAREMHHHQ